MIRNKLASLLSDRGIKITRAAAETGISRNTITNTAQNDGIMIQLETVNVLCQYLGVQPNEFFEYLPFDFKIDVILTKLEASESDNPLIDGQELDTLNFDVYVQTTSRGAFLNKTFEFRAEILESWEKMNIAFPDDERSAIQIGIILNPNSTESFTKIWRNLSAGFQSQFVSQLHKEIENQARAELEKNADLSLDKEQANSISFAFRDDYETQISEQLPF